MAHVKGALFMEFSIVKSVYVDFLHFYKNRVGLGPIVIMSEDEEVSTAMATLLVKEHVRNVCVLKGGYNAMFLDYQDVLRRGKVTPASYFEKFKNKK